MTSDFVDRFVLVAAMVSCFLLGFATCLGTAKTEPKETIPNVIELRIVVEVKDPSTDKEGSISTENSHVEAPAVYVDTKEEIAQNDAVDEAKEKDMRMLAQLIQAEAGNQDLTGMRYVADVVLNRVDSPQFPDTVEGVIFQPNQFSVIQNGAYEAAASNLSEEAIEAVRLEYEERLNYNIIYFSRGKSKYADHHFKYQDHWFGW